MALSREDIQSIARLARLHLTEEEEIRYAEELSAVLSYVDMLNQVDTTGVEETFQVTGLEDIFRTDEVVASSEEKRKLIIDAFPQEKRGMLAVPNVFDTPEE